MKIQPATLGLASPRSVLPALITLVSSGVSAVSALTARIGKTLGERLDFFSGRDSRGRMKKILPLVLAALFGAVLLFSIVRIISGSSKTADQRVTIPGPRATVNLNREFAFPLRGARGVELTKIKYFVENAQLRDEIIVKGKRATSIKGRTFLIFNLKITNDFDQAVEINVRDYMRLAVGGNEKELLAADIHNDPVAVQAHSTKLTRIGFPINDTDAALAIFVGELSGTKEKVDLPFAYRK